MDNYSPSNDLLKGRIILVTGAGDGIGKTIAITYAKYGASVILLGRTTHKLEAVYDEIKRQGYPMAAIIPMNLESRNYADYESLTDTIEQEFGHLDGLVHNAGLLGRLGPISQYEPELWDQVMQVNVHAQFLLTRAMLPLLRKGEHSSLLFTTSNLGIQGRAHWGAYAVSKFATEGLAQTLADEEKELSTLRINSINPGRIRTAMRAAAYPAEDPMTLATPDDIMPAYLYLMGPDSHDITGQRINAQG